MKPLAITKEEFEKWAEEISDDQVKMIDKFIKPHNEYEQDIFLSVKDVIKGACMKSCMEAFIKMAARILELNQQNTPSV